MKLPHLTSFEREWARAVFGAVFAAPPELAADIPDPGDAGEFMDVALARAPLEPALGIRLTLWICALAPLFVLRRFATIASLELSDRVAVLDALGKNRIYAVRQLVLGMKAMLALHFAKDARVRERLSRVSEDAVPARSIRRERRAPSAPAASTSTSTSSATGAVNDNAAE